MGVIQSAVNSMIGSAASTVFMAKHIQKNMAKQKAGKTASAGAETQEGAAQSSPQKVAAQTAEQSAANAIEAKKVQRAKIDAMETSLGGTVAQMPDVIKQRIYEELDKDGK